MIRKWYITPANSRQSMKFDGGQERAPGTLFVLEIVFWSFYRTERADCLETEESPEWGAIIDFAKSTFNVQITVQTLSLSRSLSLRRGAFCSQSSTHSFLSIFTLNLFWNVPANMLGLWIRAGRVIWNGNLKFYSAPRIVTVNGGRKANGINKHTAKSRHN